MAFVQARLATDGAPDQPVDGIEIVCDGGRRIVVRRGFDSAALGEVIKVLEGLPRDVGRGLPSREALA